MYCRGPVKITKRLKRERESGTVKSRFSAFVKSPASAGQGLIQYNNSQERKISFRPDQERESSFRPVLCLGSPLDRHVALDLFQSERYTVVGEVLSSD
jgi:hypothetical protein